MDVSALRHLPRNILHLARYEAQNLEFFYSSFCFCFSFLAARCVEVFGPFHGGVAVGTIALSDFASTAIVRIFSSLILKGHHIDYFHYFLFVMSGPIAGFIISLVSPATPGDRERMKRLKKGNCWKATDGGAQQE